MDRRFLTVLGVSLLFALVISSVFYQMTARAGSPKKTEVTDMRDIVVAARPLSVGTTVKPADIKLGKMPASAFPKGAFGKPEEVIDRPLVSNILMDEPILEGRLAARGSGLGLAPIIPVGMRGGNGARERRQRYCGLCAARHARGCAGHRASAQHRGNGHAPHPCKTCWCYRPEPRFSPTREGRPSIGERHAAGNARAGRNAHAGEQRRRIQLVLRNGSDQTIEKTPGREIGELYGERACTRRPPRTPLRHRGPEPGQFQWLPRRLRRLHRRRIRSS